MVLFEDFFQIKPLYTPVLKFERIFTVPRTMTLLVVDPIALVAVSWYWPASSLLIFFRVSVGLLILVRSSLSTFSSFFVQKTSIISGESSYTNTLPTNFIDRFLMFVCSLVVTFGRPKSTQIDV